MTAETAPAADPLAPPRQPPWPWALFGALVLALVHFLWLHAHFAGAAMSPDANGYLVQARLLAEHGHTALHPDSPAQFVGMHWLETSAGVFRSRYPAGLAVLFALAWKIGGLDAALLVNLVLASATVAAVFFLARRFVTGWLALLAALVVGAAPAANQHALSADAHTSAAFFLVTGVLALLRFGERPTIPRGLLAGGLLGLVPTMRYPEAVAGLAVAGWLLWRVRPLRLTWPALAGAALPIGAQLSHNAAAYGAFWRTGYALTNEQTGFGWNYFAAHALPYLQSLFGMQGLGFFFAFGAAGIAALLLERERRSEGLLFAGIIVPLLLLYMAYYFGGGAGTRFLIPTFPFFAVAGAWLLSRVSLAPHARPALATGVAGLQLLLAGSASTDVLARVKGSLAGAARARATAEKQTPAGSVLIADRQLAESLDATGRWRLVEEGLLGSIGFRPRPGGPDGPGAMPGPGAPPPLEPDAPNPQQIGKNKWQQERYRDLEPTERRARIWADIEEWAGGRPVYWYTRAVETIAGSLPQGADYESVAEIEAPEMIGPGGGRGGMAMGRGPGRGNLAPPMGPPMMGPVEPGGGPRRGPGMGGRGGFAGRGPPGRFADAAPAKLRLVRIKFGKQSMPALGAGESRM